MSIYDIAAILIVLAALFGVLNHFLLKLPSTIGILIIALLVSLVILGVDRIVPGILLAETVTDFVKAIDFSDALLEGMIGLLLFAGALHVRIEDLAEQKWVIGLMATFGVLLSTALVGGGFHLISGVPLLVALTFGALISPTDPVAVLGIFKRLGLPKTLETKVAGESLFNDGVGYVVFLVIAGVAFSGSGHGEDHGSPWMGALELFAVEAVGGAILGGITGWVIFQVMKRIDDYALEVLLTLALAAGTYTLAGQLHMSGPIAVVIAGLFVGNAGVKFAMSEITRDHVDAFWRLIDEILNAVLFLLIGIEVLAFTFDPDWALLSAMTIVLVLLARLIAVTIPVSGLHLVRDFTPGVIPIMTWGGLRGGLSVALVLSIPDNEWKPLLVSVTYVVVIFSIVVQGLTIKPLAERVLARPE